MNNKIQNIFDSIKGKVTKTKKNIVENKKQFFTKTENFLSKTKEQFVAKKNKLFHKKDVERAKEDITESLIEAKDIVKENLIEAKETTREQLKTAKKTTGKILTNVNEKLVVVKDKLFQTKEQEIHNGLFSVIKKNFFSIPISIRTISFSLFLFMLGWGLGADTYFSVYIKYIVDNVFWISLVGAILPFSKMILSLSIGEMNDHGDMKSLLFMSKMFYIIAGIIFFFAGIFRMPILLLVAVILNGFASATMFTTYESYIRLVDKKNHSNNTRGLYFSSINAAYVIGAIISAIIIRRMSLPSVYIFVIIFGILSLFADKKIVIHQKKHLKEVFAKESFLHQFIREVFSFKPIKDAYLAVKSYPKSMIYTLGFEALFNIMAYIGFLFIPLVAVKNNLSLSEIALVFGLMRLPYVINFFTNGWANRFDKKLFIILVILFLSFLFASFGFNESFGSIMVISFGIALGLSMIRPVISDLISEQVHENDAGTITGVQQFVAMLACIVGSIGFGLFSGIFGLQTTFVLVGLSLFVLAIWGISKKMKKKIVSIK